MKLIKQGDKKQFEIETKLFHFEFTEACNQNCSYCIEGNFDETKPKPQYSKRDDVIGTIDKIFAAYDENVNLGFIIVGGEPTTQEHFLEVINKIRSRKNTFIVLTTNFTQSIEYYRKLDVPLITSMHLESHEPKAWLEKTLALSDLIVHTRIMAHPQKMDEVKEAYALFNEASKHTPLSYSVAEIFNFSRDIQGYRVEYKANYAEEDLEFIKGTRFITTNYPQNLVDKLGILKNICFGAQWFYEKSNGEIEEKTDNSNMTCKLEIGKNNLKGYFCEHSLVTVRSDGVLIYGWGCCPESSKNIFKESKFPVNDFKTVVCSKDFCLMDMASTVPKYSSIIHAPVFKNKKELILLRAAHNKLSTKINNKLIKIVSLLIPNKQKRKNFRIKFSLD